MDQRWVEGRSTIQRNEECMYSVAECEVTLEKEVSKIVLNKGYDKEIAIEVSSAHNC